MQKSSTPMFPRLQQGTTTPKTEEPKMSVGLPPDADAVKEAEKINANKTRNGLFERRRKINL